MKTNILAIIAFTIFIAACEKDPIKIDNHSALSFMEVGNKWTYEWQVVGRSTIVTINYEISSIDDNGFAVINCNNSLYGSHTEYMWFINDDFFADESGAVPNQLFPLYYTNGAVGKKWNAPEEDDELGIISREIVSISESVTIDDTTYTNCIKVKHTYELDLNVVDYYWINKAVGIIKKEQTGWLDINDEPRSYIRTTTTLKSKNF